MSTRKNAYDFYIISRSVLTLLTFTSFRIFCLTLNISAEPASAISVYHSIPYMAEHVFAGIFAYLIFALIFTKVFHPSVYDR